MKILVVAGERGVRRIWLGRKGPTDAVCRREIAAARGAGAAPLPNAAIRRATSILERTLREIEAYFRGDLRSFKVPLDLEGQGTPFEMAVWKALQRIPHGATESYGQIAREIGRPGAARAVGRACGRNPVPILVPCHRVVGADGSLTGFSSGLALKSILLSIECRPDGTIPSHAQTRKRTR